MLGTEQCVQAGMFEEKIVIGGDRYERNKSYLVKIFFIVGNC